MAVPGLGYITNHVGLGVIVNGSSRFATTFADSEVRVIPRLITLGNGTIVHYDGTADALTTPGIVTQEVFDNAGTTAYDSFLGNLGNVGALTLTKVASGTSVADAIFIGIEDTTPVQGARAKTWYKLSWQLIGDWV
jgi:hypothetical protein